jgi:hypothetical protein
LQLTFERARYRVGQLFDRAGRADNYYPRSHRNWLIYRDAGPSNHWL